MRFERVEVEIEGGRVLYVYTFVEGAHDKRQTTPRVISRGESEQQK